MENNEFCLHRHHTQCNIHFTIKVKKEKKKKKNSSNKRIDKIENKKTLLFFIFNFFFRSVHVFRHSVVRFTGGGGKENREM